MIHSVFLYTLFVIMSTEAFDHYFPYNVSRTTPSGIAEYRSALTLDWLAAEDSRQRELALAFETESAAPLQVIASDCITYPKPASGKVARLMLELLKNLEGDEGVIIAELIHGLMRSKLLVETAMMDAEPSLEALVETPDLMKGEPHATFPRILTMIWMTATDPTTVNKIGWCPINKVAKYLAVSKPTQIAVKMREIDPVVARARFVMEDFIQHVTPNVYDKKNRVLTRTTPITLVSYNFRGSPHSMKAHLPLHSRQKNVTQFTTTTVPVDMNEYSEHDHAMVNDPLFEEEERTRNNSGRKYAVSTLLLIVFSMLEIGGGYNFR